MDIVFNFWLGVAVISIIGTLAHFVYDWTHHNKILGLFVAVNESVWEHIKIAITPTLLWSLYDGIIYGIYPNYFLGKFLSLLVLVVLMPTLFYLYEKFLKRDILFLNIAIFYISIMFSQLVFYVIICQSPISSLAQYLSCLGTFVFFGAYMTLTLKPLNNIIFKDPITGKYGFRGHAHHLKIKKPSQKK